MTFIDDLRAVIRGLYRLQKDIQGTGAWMHVEKACQELTKAITILMRGENGRRRKETN